MSAAFRTFHEPLAGSLVFEGRITLEQFRRLSPALAAALDGFSKSAPKASQSLRVLAAVFEELEGM